MAIAYLGMGLFITVTNWYLLPDAFYYIFQSAFDFESIFGGFAGSVIVLGIKRGLFSNEAGMGSAPNAAATASVSHPCKQGLVQTLSVYLDTMLVCTCSAFIVLIFFVQSGGTFGDLNGMPLVQMAINSSIGEFGIHVVTFAIFCFAFSSLIIFTQKVTFALLLRTMWFLTFSALPVLLPLWSGALITLLLHGTLLISRWHSWQLLTLLRSSFLGSGLSKRLMITPANVIAV